MLRQEQCRQPREILAAPQPPFAMPLAVPGAGRSPAPAPLRSLEQCAKAQSTASQGGVVEAVRGYALPVAPLHPLRRAPHEIQAALRARAKCSATRGAHAEA